MTNTPNLSLPFIEGGQAQKHVTHNEVLRILDALAMLSVKDRDLSAPPPAPVDGARYIVKAPGAGAFAGKDNQVAHYADGGWLFHPPLVGWTCFVEDEATLLAFDGAEWVSVLGGAGGASEMQNLTRLGLGTAADAINPFAAKLNNALWIARTAAEGGDGNLRYKLNKEAAGNTLSLLMQTGFSGRAEIGLAGDDNFHVKVSPDGSTWIDAMLFDKASGSAKINAGFFLTGDLSPAQIITDQNDYNPAGLASACILRLSSDAARNITGLSGGGDGRVVALINAGGQPIVLKNDNAGSSAGNRFMFGADVTLAARQSAILWYDAADSRWKLLAGPQAAGGGAGREILTAHRTYFVRTDGSDSNAGLTNTTGGAFLTIQKAIDVVAALDLSINNVTIQVAAGTYGRVELKKLVGSGTVTILGDVATPSNVLITTSDAGAAAILADGVRQWTIDGVKASTMGAALQGIKATNGSVITLGRNDYGACVNAQIWADNGSDITITNNYSVSGGGVAHTLTIMKGGITVQGRTITVTGTPAFSAAFAYAARLGVLQLSANSYSGSATGKRYNVEENSVIYTGGAGATYFPGGISGTVATGGQYI